MKYIKLYENVNNIQVNDWVIISSCEHYVYINEFLQNNIGKVVEADEKAYQTVLVQFDNIPDMIKRFFSYNSIKNSRYYNRKNIIFNSKNKELVESLIEAMVTSKKYNI